MSDTLQTVIAVTGLVPVAWCAFWLAFGTLNAVTQPGSQTSLHFTGFWVNAGFLLMFACAAFTLVCSL